MNFLKACQLFVGEVGVAGGTGPATVENQSGALLRVVQFVSIANDYINDLWPEWDWKWTREQGVMTPADGDTVPLPADTTKPVDEYDLEGFRVKSPSSSTWIRPTYMPFRDFESVYGNRSSSASKPVAWTSTPGRRILLSHNISENMDYRYDYYRKMPELTENDDLIEIPVPRLVVVRAKLIYAEREDAPEISISAGAEYEDILQRLEGRYLPGSAGGRFHEHDLRVELMTDHR